MSRVPLFVAFLLILGAASVACADVTLDLSAPVFTSATNGYVDLDVQGSSISIFNLTLQITTDPSNTPAYMLQFVSAGGLYTGDSTFNDPSYVFGPNSVASYSLDSLVGGFGNTTAVGGYQTTLNVGDSALDSNFNPQDVPITSANNLLARLEFELPANAAAAKFDLGLTSASFLSSTNVSIPIDSSIPISETLSVGTPIANVVPEPGTFGMLFIGMTGLLCMKRKRLFVHGEPSNS
ncbi:MAG TPA: PEP-CTERM sorting domain-containing protein [Pirellulales bacterium]|nr:PEP-CTERM sorting domain-containing protein [Pirellulales bacterium]